MLGKAFQVFVSILTWMFLIGAAGSLVVVVLTLFSDFHAMLERDPQRANADVPGARVEKAAGRYASAKVPQAR